MCALATAHFLWVAYEVYDQCGWCLYWLLAAALTPIYVFRLSCPFSHFTLLWCCCMLLFRCAHTLYILTWNTTIVYKNPSGWHYQRVTKKSHTFAMTNTHTGKWCAIYFVVASKQNSLATLSHSSAFTCFTYGLLVLPCVLSLIVQHSRELVKSNEFSFTCEGIECKYSSPSTRSRSLHDNFCYLDGGCVWRLFILSLKL